MLTDWVALLDCRQEVVFVAIAGDATKSHTKTNLSDNVYSQKLDPLADIEC